MSVNIGMGGTIGASGSLGGFARGDYLSVMPRANERQLHLLCRNSSRLGLGHLQDLGGLMRSLCAGLMMQRTGEKGVFMLEWTVEAGAMQV